MKNSKMKTWSLIGGILVIVIGLFVWSASNDPNRTTVRAWKNLGVGCLANGHAKVLLHVHPHIAITVDGVNEMVPSNIGVLPTCMAEVHTHDATGTIHVESTSSDGTFTLGQFFAVWGKPIARDGYTTVVTINGDGYMETEAAYDAIVLGDKQEIVVTYTSSTPVANQ
jgi:hypothetical protein